MKVKYNNGGRTGGEGPLESGDPVRDYIARVGGPQAITNTFGPADYVAGAFPIGRLLAPYASKVMTALGLGEDAGVNLAKEAFSRRFGTKARMGDPAFEKALYNTASKAERRTGGPYSGMDIPTTQDILGLKVAPPPSRTRIPMSPELKAQYPKVIRELDQMDQVKALVDDPSKFRNAYQQMGNYPDYDGGYYADEALDEVTRMAGRELGFLDDVGNPTKAFDDIMRSEDIASEALMNLRYPPQGSNKVFNDPTQAAFEAGNIARAQGASPEAQRMAIERAQMLAKRRLDYEKKMAARIAAKEKSKLDKEAYAKFKAEIDQGTEDILKNVDIPQGPRIKRKGGR